MGLWHDKLAANYTDTFNLYPLPDTPESGKINVTTLSGLRSQRIEMCFSPYAQGYIQSLKHCLGPVSFLRNEEARPLASKNPLCHRGEPYGFSSRLSTPHSLPIPDILYILRL